MSKQPATPPPAYFLSLSLENVRSFGEKQTISFAREDGRPAQWTIILGDNGVGKTTVLKALAGMMARKALFSSQGEEYAYAHHMMSDEEWAPKRNNFQDLLIETNIQYNGVLTEPAQESKAYAEEKWVRLHSDEHGDYECDGTSILRQDLGLICYGYGAGRKTGNSTLSDVSKTIDTCISLFDDRADLLNPEEWFLQMEYSSLKGDKQAEKSLQQVRDVLLQVLPDVTDVNIVSKGYQQQLELLTPYGWVRLRDMSLGYQTLVVWLTDFASKLFIRYPESKNPLEEPAIVLIDEIDLHLHPSWQRKLIGFLSGIFKNTQFIATAHSPLVVQAAGDKDANIVLLKRENDQTVVVQNLPDVRRWRVDQILNSELFEDASSLSPQTETDLQRRNALLLKKRLTAKEKAELKELDDKLTTQPISDTQPERRVENLLARLARNLKDEDFLE
ncbi:AAA family ATPase [Hymenobacter cellulosivorans]|uniref:AAA family ATPase n=1 Tax=Hymenobacter cellulosivorans TaxID=2932249 RepID=A0ABY4F2S6_9BACT|nr:AAA family ATPase [Hymenobacter cellulosivorans]UOQ50964.1 AAA family ATPase [Hymenobacter cellulosivorans]